VNKKGPTKSQFIKIARKNEGNGNIRIEIRNNKAKWTNGYIIVYDDPVLRDIKTGTYTVYGTAIVTETCKVGKLPISDRRKYSVAEEIRFNGRSQVWRGDGRDIIPLRSKDYTLYVDWDYYDYLVRNFRRIGKVEWKTTHPMQPVLLYCNGEMVAAVMPINAGE